MARRPRPWFWKARDAWYVTIGGQRHLLGQDKDEAYDRFYAMMRQPQQRKVSADALVAVIDAFLEWVLKNRSSDTYEWYRYRLQRFVERYPDLRADDLRPFHAETWADSYDFSVTSKRNYLRSIKRCMKWAKKQGYVDRNPIEDLEVPTAEAKEVYVSPEELQVLISYVRDQTFADLVATTYDCGCRPQELIAVTASNVDLTNGRWVFRKSESKGKRISRVVYLPDTALAITQRLMIGRCNGPIFRNVNGRPWTADSVNSGFLRLRFRMGRDEMRRRGETIADKQIEAFIPTLCPTRVAKGRVLEKTKAELREEAKGKLTNKRAAQLAPRYSLYALRHSWATNALQRGVDALTVAILMGHKDPSTLAKVYQHLSLNPQHLLEQARRAVG